MFKSDGLVPAALTEALRKSVALLENVPTKELDWCVLVQSFALVPYSGNSRSCRHPGSDGQVLDLVHPSLFCLVYGTSPRLRTPATTIQQSKCVAFACLPRTRSHSEFRLPGFAFMGSDQTVVFATGTEPPLPTFATEQQKKKASKYRLSELPEKTRSVMFAFCCYSFKIFFLIFVRCAGFNGCPPNSRLTHPVAPASFRTSTTCTRSSISRCTRCWSRCSTVLCRCSNAC